MRQPVQLLLVVTPLAIAACLCCILALTDVASSLRIVPGGSVWLESKRPQRPDIRSPRLVDTSGRFVVLDTHGREVLLGRQVDGWAASMVRQVLARHGMIDGSVREQFVATPTGKSSPDGNEEYRIVPGIEPLSWRLRVNRSRSSEIESEMQRLQAKLRDLDSRAERSVGAKLPNRDARK